MKNKKLNLLLTLAASTVLASCGTENSFVQKGSDPVATLDSDGKYSNLNLQDFYIQLKESSGGSKALEVLLEKLIGYEYADQIKNGTFAKTVKDSTGSDVFNVRQYRTLDALKEDVNDFFKDIVDGTGYTDNDGKFDADAYKDHIEDSYDYEKLSANDGTSNWISDASLLTSLKYNYDQYIEDEVLPDLYEQYFYEDYVLGSSTYQKQFANQYAFTFESLKIDNYTTAENSAWTESLIRDVKAVSTQANADSSFTFKTDYSFVTFNSDNDLLVLDATASAVNYYVIANTDAVEDIYNKFYDRELKEVTNTTSEVATLLTSATPKWSWNASTKCDTTFFKEVEEVLIARKLFNIDHEVAMARNYDFKNDEYYSYTETKKSEASGYVTTYSNSGLRSIKEGAKQSKITAQQTKYYTEKDTYTKSNYTDNLPTAITNLRGTTAKELMTNLYEVNDENYLLPQKDNMSSPVYLDGDYYYICKVYNWYGLYLTSGNIYDRNSKYKSVPDYQAAAYREGYYYEYELNNNVYKAKTDADGKAIKNSTLENQEIIDLCQASVSNIVSSSMKTEAVVELLEKYGLEINDEDVYTYIESQYPDYFDEED